MRPGSNSLTDDNGDAFYRNGSYTRRNPGWNSWDAPYKAAEIAKLLVANQVTPASVCDVGCGSGQVLEEVATRLPSLVRAEGWDIRPEAQAIWATRSDRLRFFLGDFFQSSTLFDLVMAIDVIEHVENPFAFLRNLRTHGRHFIFHIPLDLSAATVTRHSLERTRAQVGHIHFFTKELALATLADAGYAIDDAAIACPSAHLPARGWPATAGKLVRKVGFATNAGLAARTIGGGSLMVLAHNSASPD